MLAPGGEVLRGIACDGCQRVLTIVCMVTPRGTPAGVHIRQLVFHTPDLTVRGGKLYCDQCDERERLQLDLKHG